MEMLIVVTIIALFLWQCERADHAKTKASIRMSACHAMNRAGVYKALAKELEIEADGGDSPEAFVEHAVMKVWKDCNEYFAWGQS